MQKIDLNKIMDEHELDMKYVARHLFPNNKFPHLAFKRVLDNEIALNADQISLLALLTGRTIASLFSGENWKGRVDKSVHIFTNGDYRAELDTRTWVTKVFHKGSLFHEEVIHSDTVPLNKYLAELDQIILKKEQRP